MVTRDIQEIKELINLKFTEGTEIISVDGWMGAGKTTLSNSLIDNQDVELISFDDYFEKNTGQYLDVFNFDELKDTISKELESGKKIIIEGICMQKVLSQISIESGYKVYIKKLDILEEWYYQKYLDKTKTTEEIFIEDDKENAIDILSGVDSQTEDKSVEVDTLAKERKGLFYDLVRYHREFEPENHYDLMFERLEEDV